MRANRQIETKTETEAEREDDRSAIMFPSLGLLLKRHLTPRNAGMSADVFLIR